MEHRDIAEDNAKKMREYLMAMTARDCATLQKNMEDKISEGVKEIRRKEDVYDRQTNHGVTQGAKF